MSKTAKNAFVLAASALLAGLINGLLGAGGGIVAVWGLSRALSEQMTDRRDAFANALLIMLPMSVISLVAYSLRGLPAGDHTSLLLLPAIAGGFGGALILDRINVKFLKILFAVIVVYSGFTMLLR